MTPGTRLVRYTAIGTKLLRSSRPVRATTPRPSSTADSRCGRAARMTVTNGLAPPTAKPKEPSLDAGSRASRDLRPFPAGMPEPQARIEKPLNGEDDDGR